MKQKLLFFTLFLSYSAYCQQETQVRREPVPYHPPLVNSSVKENGVQKASSGPISTGYNMPSGSAESAMFNAVQDIPVNLYTGTPVVEIPIYNLTEGRLSVPVGLSYNPSMIKPQSLSGWAGLGWELTGIPTISRIVRGMPDEGFTSNGQGRKGYLLWGCNITDPYDPNLDKEPDYFFINTPSGSGKFMFDCHARAFFFPISDVKVKANMANNPNESGSNHYAKRFTSFEITFPDGIKYTFDQANNESSAEVEVKAAQSGNIYPGGSGFSQFIKDNLIPLTWYCSKIESPYGEVINFTYDRMPYSYYKSGDQKGVNYCPTGSGMDKKINKVYVRSSQIREITSSNLKIRFNGLNRLCHTDNSVTPAEEVCTTSNGRTDLDSWGNAPTNSVLGKRLDEIIISDNESSPTSKLTYTLNYGYFNANNAGLPTGYSASDVGTTHLRRLKLQGISTPDGNNYSFKYDSENENLISRLSYGIDHWGYGNGVEANLSNPNGFVGSEIFSPNISDCGSNREPVFAIGKKGVLTEVKTAMGGKTTFIYEAHQVNSGPSAVGGMRIKSVRIEDPLRNISLEKTYTYKLANNESSGRIFLIPSYRVTYFPGSPPLVYFAHSNLFSSMLTESGRPEVAYQRVTEEIHTIGSSPSNGKTITEFDMDPTVGTLRDQPWISCPDCDTNPVNFNLSHDFRQGNIKKQEIYNASGQLISKTETQYTPNGGIKQDSIVGVRYYNSSYSFPGYTGNFTKVRGYRIFFKKYRIESTTTTLFSPNGSGTPSVNTVEYTYKDEMPPAYQTKYKGRHQMPVKITGNDEEGNSIESRMLYVADFNFDQDTIIVCPTDIYCPPEYECPGPMCMELQITEHVPPYSSEGRGIYESLRRNLLAVPIETRQIVNGQTVSANYTGLFSDNNASITLPRRTYSLKKIPKSSFAEAYYNKPTLSMIKDSDYGTSPDSEILSYNSKGQIIDTKLNKGATSRVLYLNPTVSNGTVSNPGKPDAMSQNLTFGKIYLGPSKITYSNLLEKRIERDASSGRILMERDKNDNIIRRYFYHVDPDGVSSISWDDSFPLKFCIGSDVYLSVYVNGLIPGYDAQFSTDGGVTWQNANLGSNGFSYSRPVGTGLQEIRARASDKPSSVITTYREISCATPSSFGWGNIFVSNTGNPSTCTYKLTVTGLSPGGVAQFSVDNFATHYTATPPNIDTATYLLLKAPSTQQFWARDSNYPGNIITIHVNTCQP
ncbi:MAG: hypothetical protein KF860_17370 [Cyclobacteriaceae bacterium]|nr:hypothetical protein [Cyclobacteriaceae bacterium]